MNENIKSFSAGLMGLGLVVLSIIGFISLIVGGARLFEVIYPFLEGLSSFTWTIVWLLLILSIFPGLRNFTGMGILIGTYIGGAIFWFLCFYITYSLWGLLGIIIGVLFMGFGVFFTAVLALLFNGEFGLAFNFIFILIQIYLFRLFSAWIITKYKSKKDDVIFPNNTL